MSYIHVGDGIHFSEDSINGGGYAFVQLMTLVVGRCFLVLDDYSQQRESHLV